MYLVLLIIVNIRRAYDTYYLCKISFQKSLDYILTYLLGPKKLSLTSYPKLSLKLS